MTNSNRYRDYTDEELIRLYRRDGESRWLGVLLQRYTTLLLGVAMKYLKDKDAAADAVQQVLLKVLTKFPNDDVVNFKGWIYILMRNHCFQLHRDKKNDSHTQIHENIIADEPTDREELYAQEKLVVSMEQALTELDDKQSICIKKFYLEKKSYQQIMDEEGYSFKQVKSYIQNGKRKLKQLITEKNNKVN